MKALHRGLPALLLAAVVGAQSKVEIIRAPEGAAQPDVAVDGEGALHLVYFVVDPKTNDKPMFRRSGDLHYSVRRPGDAAWSEPIRVNSVRNQVSRLSFPRIAVGGNGRVHVAWSRFRPQGMWYARMADDGASFDDTRSLLADGAQGIEAGPAVAADHDGNVWVVWHEGAFSDEPNRVVAVRRSTDEGATFAAQRKANPASLGVCSCCNLHAALDNQGKLHVSFRASVGGIHKDMVLLVSEDGGESFDDRLLDKWQHKGCPTSGTFLADGGAGALVAWETEGVVLFGDAAGDREPIAAPPSVLLQKHPGLATNAAGEVLLAWIELTKKPRRKQLKWQVYGADGKPTDSRSKDQVVLTNTNTPALVARPDGGFVMVW